MIVEILTRDGIGRAAPLRVPANQVLIRQDNGTLIAVAAEIGGRDSQVVSMVGQPDFRRVLDGLGIGETVVCDTVEMPPPPPGARLVRGPRAQ